MYRFGVGLMGEVVWDWCGEWGMLFVFLGLKYVK